MRRRDSLKQTGAATLATASVVGTSGPGPVVRASDTAGSTNPVIGKGEHRYNGGVFIAKRVQTGRVSFLRHVS